MLRLGATTGLWLGPLFPPRLRRPALPPTAWNLFFGHFQAHTLYLCSSLNVACAPRQAGAAKKPAPRNAGSLGASNGLQRCDARRQPSCVRWERCAATVFKMTSTGRARSPAIGQRNTAHFPLQIRKSPELELSLFAKPEGPTQPHTYGIAKAAY